MNNSLTRENARLRLELDIKITNDIGVANKTKEGKMEVDTLAEQVTELQEQLNQKKKLEIQAQSKLQVSELNFKKKLDEAEQVASKATRDKELVEVERKRAAEQLIRQNEKIKTD